MRNLLTFIFLSLAIAANAASRITATLVITNPPAVGDYLTVNASTRTWTNAASTTTIQTNTTIGGSTTNLYNHIAANPFSLLVLNITATNTITLVGQVDQALAVTADTNWATVTLVTQVVALAKPVRVPMASEPTDTVRTNIAAQLVSDLSTYSSNAFTAGSTAISTLVQTTGNQTVAGNKTFTGATSITNGSTIYGSTFTNGALYATSGTLTGVYQTNGTGSGLRLTNTVATGGFYSISGAAGGEAYGASATATGTAAVAVGPSATANNDYAIAIGNSSTAGEKGVSVGLGASSATNATAVGWAAGAENGATALGQSAQASGINSIAIGASAGTDAAHSYSAAIGYAATTARSNQVMLGSAGYADSSVTAPNRLYVVTNLVVGGTDGAVIVAGLLGGLTLADGTGPTANPTNQSVLCSVSGELLYRTPTTSEGAGANNRVHNRAAEVVGSGSDYSLTGSYARIDFGGTDVELALPTAGTYLIEGIVSLQTGATANDEYYVKLYNSTDAADIANSEGHTQPSGNTAHYQIRINSIVTVTAAKTLQLYGYNATAARGKIEAIHTKLIYVRLY